jgi:hypothetical protein
LLLGWQETDRGDPWVVAYERVFPWREERNAVPELRRIMGDYWLSDEEFKALRGT